MVRRTCSSLLLAALIGVGGACDGSLDPIRYIGHSDDPLCPHPPASNPWESADEPADRMIADFELGTQDLARVAGRDGYWVLGTDLTSKNIIAAPSGKCKLRGAWAGQFTGYGFTNWWANWTAVFRVPTSVGRAVAYDGSAYGGFSFWAAFGPNNPLAFEVPVGVSTMDTAWNGTVCSGNGCADHYLTTVPLTNTWQRFEVRFDAMKQGGVGYPQVSMRRDQLVGFVIWPRQAFEIWIDDLRFEP